jgi:hypothetical protein
MHRLYVFLLLGIPLLSLEAQDARIAARFPPVEAVAISSLVDSAATDGLPREPLVLRALEGAAKGIPGPQVRAVLARFREAMGRARDALGKTSDATELSTAASALLVGVPASQLSELRSMLGRRTITVPLGTYLDLMAKGIPPETAWGQVAVLARKHAPDNEFTRLTPGLSPKSVPR